MAGLHRPRAPRPPDEEITQRVADVYVLLLNGTPRRHILQHAAKAWGVQTRQADEYIARASAEFKAQSALVYEQEHGKALARLDDLYYRAIKKDDIQRALEAQRERNKVIGLYAPTRTELTGADNGPIQTEIILRQIPERQDD
jgi:hypothetical protein